MGILLALIGGVGLGGCFVYYGAQWIKTGVPINAKRTIQGNNATIAGVSLIVIGIALAIGSLTLPLLGPRF